MNVVIKTLILMVAVSFLAVPIVSADSGGKKLFKKKCKMCHAVDKKKSGPALTAMSQDTAQLRDAITNGGKKKKMMKAYGSKLSADEIDELVAYIRSKQSDDDDDHDRKKDKKKDKKKHDKKKHDKDDHDDDDNEDDDDDKKKDKKKKHDKDDHDDD